MSFVRDFRRLSPSQRHTFVAAFLGWTLDSLDFFLLIFCVKAISADFHAKPSDVLSAVFLTQAFRPVGALLFGILADRYGRRPVLMFNILSFSVIELACAFAPSLGMLLGLASTRILAAIVYGASANDPLVVSAVVLTMLVTGILSAALPARRALTVEPASLLREE